MRARAGSVWIHAASVGEVAAAQVLWEALPGPRFLTTDTDAGLARARRFTQACARRPWDLPGAVDAALAQARPSALVFVEGTFWPWLARRAARAGVPVLRVSCKAGRRTRSVPAAILRRLWAPTSAVAARDAEEASFLGAVHRAPVEVLGDLKAGGRPPPSPLRWTRPFVVGASLRPGDVPPLVAAWRQLKAPRPGLLLAPRHQGEPAGLDGLRWCRRSGLLNGVVPDNVDVVWLDTMGELAGCLQGAAAAFVGGTFEPAVGGHSAAEAMAWGVPTLAGPDRHSNPQSLSHAEIVPTPQQLGPALEKVLGRPPPARLRDEGVGDRVATFVLHHARPCPELSPRPWARPWVAPYRWLQRADTRRRRLRDPVRAAVPVVSVGSANARSPGRTSTVAWLAEQLSRRGHRVGIATRGYRRRRFGLQTSWGGGPAHDRLGDEGAMLAHRWPVAACSDRGRAVASLVAHGCTVVLLDDGRQCIEVARDLEVEVVDGRYPAARGMLPAGERRSPDWGTGDVLLVHHPEAWPDRPTGAIPVRRRPGPWHRGGRPCSDGPSGPAVVWLGVGHPEDVVHGLGIDIDELLVGGDHSPPPADLSERLRGRPLVCTEKDRARLPAHLAAQAWTQALQLEVADLGWLDRFCAEVG